MSSRIENKKNKRKKLNKFFKIALIILGVILLTFGGYAYYLYSSVKGTANNMHEAIELDAPKPKISKGNESVTILLMGVDERKGDKGRADTLIMMTLNPKTNSMQMVSIPRDTYTQIVGKGKKDKINHSYAFGGTKMTVDTVEKFTGVPINYYIKVNMEGLEDIVNALGGITVKNDYLAFNYEGYNFHKGYLNLNGKQALAYSRMRKEDPRGDFGREERQRQVINAIIDKGASINSVTKVSDILGSIGSNVKTNLTFDEMKYLLANYRDCRNNSQSYQVQGKGQMLGSPRVYYYVVSEEEREHVNNLLNNHLTASK